MSNASPTSNFVTDTMGLVLHLEQRKMGQAAEKISDIPELHDRLIAGTAHALDLELITNDPVIQASAMIKTSMVMSRVMRYNLL